MPAAVELDTAEADGDAGFVAVAVPQRVELDTAVAGAAVSLLSVSAEITAEGGSDIGFEIRLANNFIIGGAVDVDDAAAPSVQSRSWTDPISETGSGEFTLSLEDAALVPLDTTMRFCTFYYFGAAAKTILIEERESTPIASSQEHAGELVKYTGRGHVCVLEQGVVYPALGLGKNPIEEDRMFNWASLDYDDSTWANATEILLMFYARATWAGLVQDPPAAQDFPDDTAWVLWDGTVGTYITAPPGQCFFRQFFTVPNDGAYIISVIQDDWGPVYLDGAKIGDQNTDFIQATQYRVQLSAGSHLIASAVLNFFLADPAHNPGGFAFCVNDDNNGKAGNLHAHSDNTAKIFPYSDAPPGMPIGQILNILMDECVERGVWPNAITRTWTNTTDSLGADWPLVSDVATKVGTDVLTFFRELSATYIDFWMDPLSFTLNAVNIGTRGVTPDPFDAGGIFLQGNTKADPTDASGAFNVKVLDLKITDRY